MIKKILDKLFCNTVYEYGDYKDIGYDYKNKSILEVGKYLLDEKKKKKDLENRIIQERQDKMNSTLYKKECGLLVDFICYFLNKKELILYNAFKIHNDNIYIENIYKDYYPRVSISDRGFYFRCIDGDIFSLGRKNNGCEIVVDNDIEIIVGYDKEFYIYILLSFKKQQYNEKIFLDFDSVIMLCEYIDNYTCFDFDFKIDYKLDFYSERILNSSDTNNKKYLILKKIQEICDCIDAVIKLEFKLETGRDF